MNPLFVIIVFILAFFIWVSIAWIFPKIGSFINNYAKDFNKMINEKEEEDILDE